jgi:ABC-2 type transport system ATP-binding protein
VLQSSGMYSHVTPREALAHWASFYPAPRDVDEVIALVGLEEKADARSRTLSGGQLRRLDFALALVGDPELIFLDEPTTGFDPAARRDAWETVRNLREGGKTILLTTHYLDEAQALADRVAIVKDGRVLAVGPPRELGAHPPGAHPPGAAQYTISYRGADGARIERQTEDPTRLLNELTHTALERGERLEELSVGRPTLEDVYLELTADE